MTQHARPSEIALPVAGLAALRDALVETVGADPAARALRRAGHAAGDSIFDAFAAAALGPGRRDASDADALRDLDAPAFWRRLSDFFSSRGWGSLTFLEAHEGVGALESSSWIEARPDLSLARPSCHFTTGMLANLLGRVAGSPVAVLESRCRSAGDDRCTFLFANPLTLETVYGELLAGTEPEDAIARLR
jgi:hypothetical protein